MVQIDKLAREINEYLTTFANGVGDSIEVAAKNSAREGVKLLKATSPENRGSYKTGWRMKQIEGGKGYVIHNATDYQLTHLLEHGHVLQSGGRAKAVKHIKPVEDLVVKQFMLEVERAIYK